MANKQSNADQFWKEIISISRKNGKSKGNDLENLIRRYAVYGVIPTEESKFSCTSAIENRIRLEKKRKTITAILIILFFLIMAIPVSLDLLSGGETTMLVLGIPTSTLTPTPTSTPTITPTLTYTPTPTLTTTPLPTQTPTKIPSLYEITSTNENLLKLPFSFSEAYLIPGIPEATPFNDPQDNIIEPDSPTQRVYDMDKGFDAGEVYALFYLDNQTGGKSRDLRLSVSKAGNLIDPIIGSGFLRTSSGSDSPDWLFAGLYEWTSNESMTVILETVSEVEAVNDVLIIRIKKHDIDILMNLVTSFKEVDNFSLKDVTEVYGVDSVPLVDGSTLQLNLMDECLQKKCIKGTLIEYSKTGEHRFTENHRLIIHLPNNQGCSINITVADKNLTGVEIEGLPGWYLSDIFKLQSTGNERIIVTCEESTTLNAGAVFLLWEDPRFIQ